MVEQLLADAVRSALQPLRDEVARLTAAVERVEAQLPPQLVPLAEAAERMGVSVATARRRVRDGSWPSRRDGARLLVDLAQLRPLSKGEVVELVDAVAK